MVILILQGDFGDSSCVPANEEALDGGISAFLLGYVSQISLWGGGWLWRGTISLLTVPTLIPVLFCETSRLG